MTIETDETNRLWEELALLRQSIIRADPSVMLDGRFEAMIITPITVIAIARELIALIPELRQAEALVKTNLFGRS